MERTILLYDQFGQNWWDDSGITAKGFLEDLKDCNDDAECSSILVAINSPGGSIGEGIAIYNAIINQNRDANAKPINTRNDGIAYSMGAIVLLAGKKVSAFENTTTMLHCCSGGVWGNVRDIQNRLGQMVAVDKGLAKNIASKTGKTLEAVESEIMNYDDHFYTSDEAKDLGLIDEVISERTELAAQFEGLSYEQVMAKFRKKPDTQASFLDDLKNTIRNGFDALKPKPSNSKPQQSLEEPMKISNKLTALLAVFGLSASAEKEEHEHTPTAEQLKAINDQLQAANGHKAVVDDLNNKLSEKDQSISDLQAKITALEKGSNAAPTASAADDVVVDGPEADSELSESDAMVKAMREDLGFETKTDK